MRKGASSLEIVDGAFRVGIVGLGRRAGGWNSTSPGWSDEVVHGKFDTFLPPYPWTHASAYSYLRETRIVAGADVDAEAREIFGRRWRVDDLYASYEEMLANEALDIVSVTTQAPLHAEVVAASIRAGVRGVYVEKPLACTLREVDELVEMCETSKTALAYGAQRRYDKPFEEATAHARSGLLGTIQRAYSISFGGGLFHSHSHTVDTLLYLLGDPVPVAVRAQLTGVELEDGHEGRRFARDPGVAWMSVECEGGVSFDILTVAAKRVEYALLGTQGEARIRNNGRSLELSLMDDEASDNLLGQVLRRGEEETYPYMSTGGANLVKDLLDSVRTGQSPRGGMHQARWGMEVLFGAVDSHLAGGKPIELPLARRDAYVPSR